MEEKKEGTTSVKMLQKQLMESKEQYAALYNEYKQRVESMNYQNAFNQQHFMIELLKLHDVIGEEMTAKVIKSIDNFWFNTNENEG